MGNPETVPDPQPMERRWAEVRVRMEKASKSLARQGSVAGRLTPAGSRVWSVRFVEAIDGRRTQRVLYLGADAELIRRARELLATYRERERWACEVEEAARFVSRSDALDRRMLATRRRGSGCLGGC